MWENYHLFHSFFYILLIKNLMKSISFRDLGCLTRKFFRYSKLDFSNCLLSGLI